MESRCGLLKKGPVRGAAPEAKVLGVVKTPKKCIVGIYFINFTAKNNALHMLGKKSDFWHLGGHGSFGLP